MHESTKKTRESDSASAVNFRISPLNWLNQIVNPQTGNFPGSPALVFLWPGNPEPHSPSTATSLWPRNAKRPSLTTTLSSANITLCPATYRFCEREFTASLVLIAHQKAKHLTSSHVTSAWNNSILSVVYLHIRPSCCRPHSTFAEQELTVKLMKHLKTMHKEKLKTIQPKGNDIVRWKFANGNATRICAIHEMRRDTSL